MPFMKGKNLAEIPIDELPTHDSNGQLVIWRCPKCHGGYITQPLGQFPRCDCGEPWGT